MTVTFLCISKVRQLAKIHTYYRAIHCQSNRHISYAVTGTEKCTITAYNKYKQKIKDKKEFK